MITVHGYTVSQALTKRALIHLATLSSFQKSTLQGYIDRADVLGLMQASQEASAGRHVGPTEISDRVADRMIQAWRKAGIVAQGEKRGYWMVVGG